MTVNLGNNIEADSVRVYDGYYTFSNTDNNDCRLYTNHLYINGGNVSLNIDTTVHADTQIYSGGTLTLNAAKDYSFGPLQIDTNGTLDLNGKTIADVIDLNGGTLVNNNGTATVSGDITSFADSQIGGEGDLTISGEISEWSDSNGFEKTGTGKLTLIENNNYNGGTTISEGTLQLGSGGNTGNVGGDIEIAEGARLIINRTGDFNNNISGKGMIEIKQDISFAGIIDVTATQNPEDAAFQGGSLNIAADGTLKTTLADGYTMTPGIPINVYIGNEITFTKNDNSKIEVANSLYEIIGDGLQYKNNQLFYTIQRGKISDIFPLLPPDIGIVIDDYHLGENEFIDNVLESGNTRQDTALQSAFDIANQTAAMSALYHTKQNIGNAIYTRTQIVPGYFGTHYRGQSNNISIKREAWAAPIYGNSKGFRLNSGNFRYGHVNDQYAMAFGIDTVDKGMRLGIMGLGGWGKARSSGEVLTTYNESNFGGLYFYANTINGNTDYLFTAGYLGMDNDFEQVNLGGNLSGKMSSGLANVSATLTKTYCLGEMHMMPVIGIEYGYYHQGSSDVSWNNTLALHNDKSHANIFVLPIGVNFSSENRLANGAILTPEFRAKYIANVGDVVSSYAVSLPGSSSTALMATRMSDRHAGDFGVGLGVTRGGTTLRLDYGYMFSEHYRDHYGSTMARWAF